MVEPVTCTKPGCERPRSNGQRWCRECRAADKRERRAGNTTGNSGEHAGNGEQPGNAARGPEVLGESKGFALVRARVRIAELEEEVARYKRLLAEANTRLDALTSGEDNGGAARPNPAADPASVDPRAAGRARRSETRTCIHGSRNCQELACRLGA